MQQNNDRKLVIAVIAVLVAILLITIVTLSLRRHPTNPAVSPKTTTVTDPTSHQQVTTQQGKAPETNGSTNKSPTYLGFGTLINLGLTVQQVSVLQVAFQRYQPFTTSSPQISLAVDDIQQLSSDQTGDSAGRWSIKSHIVVNNKDTYKIQFFYSGISEVQLHIYDASGQTQLYDSGDLDATVLSQETNE